MAELHTRLGMQQWTRRGAVIRRMINFQLAWLMGAAAALTWGTFGGYIALAGALVHAIMFLLEWRLVRSIDREDRRHVHTVMLAGLFKRDVQ